MLMTVCEGRRRGEWNLRGRMREWKVSAGRRPCCRCRNSIEKVRLGDLCNVLF